MKRHGNYDVDSPFDIGVGIEFDEKQYVGNAFNKMRQKARNDKRGREKRNKRKMRYEL